HVIARRVDPGDTVLATNGTALFSIADLSTLQLRAELEERDAGRIAVGESVTISLPGESEPWAHGRVVRVGVGVQSRTIDVAGAGCSEGPMLLGRFGCSGAGADLGPEAGSCRGTRASPQCDGRSQNSRHHSRGTGFGRNRVVVLDYEGAYRGWQQRGHAGGSS